MKNLRYPILIVVVLASLCLAFLDWRGVLRPGDEGSGFDARRIIDDIEVISRERHSVAHPEARAEVRDYLAGRLAGLGAEVDTLDFPGCEARGYSFDASCLVADFPPVGDSSATRLLMVAHYDSRYPWVPVRDTTCSYGAADDGYGLGVILEATRLALQWRGEWSQGLRILFTDAEEVGMVGMKAVYESRKDLFEDVGMVINVEARGPFGPALLFESSGDMGKILDLYGETGLPYTYSLTNVVYGFMPNFTDFTVVKDDIPGMNFSTVADVNHYHTTLDNFEAVNRASLEHYGAQIVPVMREYLCSGQYADVDYLRGESDRVFFTTPLLGMSNFSRTGWLIVNIVVLLLFAALIALDGKHLRGVVGRSFSVLGMGLAVAGLGIALTWLSCLVSGAEFKLFGVITGVGFDNVLMIASVAGLFVIILRRSILRQETGLRLFATLIVLAVLSLALLLTIGENLLFLIPLACGVVCVILWQLTSWRWLLLPGIVVLILHAASFLHTLAMALTIGALGAVLLIAYFDLLVLVALCDCFLMEKEK